MNHTLKIRIFALFIWIIANSNPLQASGGDDHSHGPEEDLKSVQTAKYFSIEASSDKYELLLRYEPIHPCLLYTSPSPRDRTRYRMPSSA